MAVLKEKKLVRCNLRRIRPCSRGVDGPGRNGQQKRVLEGRYLLKPRIAEGNARHQRVEFALRGLLDQRASYRFAYRYRGIRVALADPAKKIGKKIRRD